ncbi:MAG: ABC transporter ATP-binding protein [Chitinophagaceae bacterium]|nr:ABC transporter ATP-binding protein [Chitinophagaceae bacterium]
MTAKDNSRGQVWLNIYRLVRPYRRKLFLIFAVSLLATGVTLVEPLIYREAVNDISGLFVQRENSDTIEGLTTPKDTVTYTYDTIHYLKDTIILKTEKLPHGKHHRARSVILKQKKEIDEAKVVKQPHTHTYVAPRTSNQVFNTLVWSVVGLFLINVIGLFLWRIGENMNVRLSSTIERKFIQRTFGHVLQLPLSFFTRRSSAALHKQIDQSEEISGTVTHITKDVFPEVVSLIGILTIMFWQNWVLALLSISIIPFYLLLTIRSTRRLETSLSAYYDKWEEVSARMQDALAGIKTVKLSGAEQREAGRLDTQATGAYQDYMQRSFLSNKYVFWQLLLTHLATALVLSYGGYLALQHKLTPGDVVMYVTYLTMLYDPIDNLASIWAEIQQNVSSVARAFRLLDTKITAPEGTQLQLSRGKIEFQHVQFGYSPERMVLNDLSFTAEPGKVTALVGGSGAGKTTTVDLLLKLFEPQSGRILIDGQDISTIEEASIRKNIGMVNADGAIFRGTLADNIRYKRPDATDNEVEQAAIAAGMQATLQRLPQRLQTPVGESGFGLSVGERQRLQLARVIVDKPHVLILDEATANLDYATEAEVKKTIDVIRKTNTIIIIAHRFSMVKDADHVIVLDAGRIIEEGTPAELIEKEGWFAGFANAGEDEEIEDPAGEDQTSEEDEGS